MNSICKRLLTALMVSGCVYLSAQAQRFVYLQTADQSPFYVQMGGKTYSSTASGYLLLGKLADSVYHIRLGVLGSTDVQEYGLRVAGKDAGYYIKKSGEQQAWTLTNMLTGETQFSLEYSSALAAEKARQELAVRRADSIAAATAAAEKAAADRAAAEKAAAEKLAMEQAAARQAPAASASQPAVAPAPVVVALAAAPVPATPAVPDAAKARADSLARVIAEKEQELKALQAALAASSSGSQQPAALPQPAPQPMAPPAAAVPAPVVGKAPAVQQPGQPALLDMEFSMPAKDCVAMPARDSVAKPTKAATDSVAAPPVPVAPLAKDTLAVPALPASGSSQPARVRDVFASGSTPAATTALADTLAPVPAPADRPDSLLAPVTVANADNVMPKPAATMPADTAYAPKVADKLKRNPCTSLLDREQLAPLQQQAARLTDSDEIVQLYKKAFAGHCITTSNLRRIAGGLASDVARYKLLEAAYPYTLDYYAYAELSALLTDTYYLNKFKTLLSQ